MGKKYTQARTHARISSYRKSTRTSSTPSLSTEIFNLTKSSHPVLSTTYTTRTVILEETFEHRPTYTPPHSPKKNEIHTLLNSPNIPLPPPRRLPLRPPPTPHKHPHRTPSRHSSSVPLPRRPNPPTPSPTRHPPLIPKHNQQTRQKLRIRGSDSICGVG